MDKEKKLRIGIYLNQNSLAGGGYYESLSNAKNFNREKFNVTYFTSNRNCLKELNKESISVFFIKINYFDRFMLFIRRFILVSAANITPGNITPVKLIKKFLPNSNRFEKHFVNKKICLIYFLSPDVNCFFLEKINYIITVWDLAHNNIAFFPELRENNTFETRETYYQKVLPKSYAIVIGHDLTKNLLIRKYLQDPNKIFTIPFKPSFKIIEQEQKNTSKPKLLINGLPKKYLYYPAQYAAHKNHRILIDAIEYLQYNGNKDFGLVFSGSDRGNLQFLKEIVIEKKLSNAVVFLPFISDEEVYSVFKNSFALAMPTYLGPGTLPTMEAMLIGIPLILPDFEFNKEFYGNASLYYESSSSLSLAKQIIELSKLNLEKFKLINSAKSKYYEIINSNESEKLIKHLEKFSAVMYSYKKY